MKANELLIVRPLLCFSSYFSKKNTLEFEQAPGDGDGQGGLMCCSPWGRKELDTTKRLN